MALRLESKQAFAPSTASDKSMVFLEYCRNLAQNSINSCQYTSAIFWAGKAVTISNGDPQDVYMWGKSMSMAGQYLRAADMIKQYKLDKTPGPCQYLAACCLFDAKAYQKALQILDPDKNEVFEQTINDASFPVNIQSCLALIKGKIYDAMENRDSATSCYKDALKADVHCYEAFQALVQHRMLTEQEETDLFASLTFPTGEEGEVVRALYLDALHNQKRQIDRGQKFSIAPALANDTDVLVQSAERLLTQSEVPQCLKISQQILKIDPYHPEALVIHIQCLLALKQNNELFLLAHRLVDANPGDGIAWFAVGAYYCLIGKYEASRRFLSKATSVSKLLGPAWLLFGHAFAAENEHDQAMAAYFKASQVMKGSHFPLLYIGLQYGLIRNTKLAEKFLNQALTMAPKDPVVYHEMGVVAFQNRDYPVAEKYLEVAFSILQANTPTDSSGPAPSWEPLFNNLGHVSRKLKKYEQALNYHQQALVLCPLQPSTLSAIGFVYALMGQYDQAAQYFHQALGRRREDIFTTSMLNYVMEAMMDYGEKDSQDDIKPSKVSEPSMSDSVSNSPSVSRHFTPAPSGSLAPLRTRVSFTGLDSSGDVEMD